LIAVGGRARARLGGWQPLRLEACD